MLPAHAFNPLAHLRHTCEGQLREVQRCLVLPRRVEGNNSHIMSQCGALPGRKGCDGSARCSTRRQNVLQSANRILSCIPCSRKPAVQVSGQHVNLLLRMITQKLLCMPMGGPRDTEAVRKHQKGKPVKDHANPKGNWLRRSKERGPPKAAPAPPTAPHHSSHI